MRTNITGILSSVFLLFLLQNCTQNWTTAIKKGKTLDCCFYEIIQTENVIGLIIVPVNIKGKEYRFLFDTGAILSLSKELQEKFNFVTVSRGNIVDSDNNKMNVEYVEIDTIFIGDIPFIEQTAFVSEFDNNPVIGCLNIDGIIGSNLMRHCNWEINYHNSQISLFKDTTDISPGSAYQIPFHTDSQFSQLVQFKFGKATLKNIKVDYGSNGSITLSTKGFNVLKKHEIVDKTFKVAGYSQSGLSGQTIKENKEIAFADTIKAGNLKIPEVELKTGKSGLLGTKVLSRFIVTIDYDSQNIYFEPVVDAEVDNRTFGFGIGYSDEKQIYVMRVIENSSAAKSGLTPGTQILKIDSLDFTQNSTLCDYILYNSVPKEDIIMEIIDKQGENKIIKLKKTQIY